MAGTKKEETHLYNALRNYLIKCGYKSLNRFGTDINFDGTYVWKVVHGERPVSSYDIFWSMANGLFVNRYKTLQDEHNKLKNSPFVWPSTEEQLLEQGTIASHLNRSAMLDYIERRKRLRDKGELGWDRGEKTERTTK